MPLTPVVCAITSATAQATKKIFELYENKGENTPLFVFNVTMQNHGGYDWDGDGYFDKRIYLTGEEQDKYPTVDQYLSLVRYSDDAVQELISYFKGG